ncbi:MAG: hypothetical protein ABWY06_10450 [Pseudomonas sp.]|uniref:hypothetical protein n=1 Tax=Pseudomonas sp. TaxID=306 RepID=UPI003392891C
MNNDKTKKSAAILLIEEEIALISYSAEPDTARARGLLEMAEATQVLDLLDIRYWKLQVNIACYARRQNLRYHLPGHASHKGPQPPGWA